MFGWLTGRFKPGLPVEDRVWLDANACLNGLRGDVERALRFGDAVLLLTQLGSDAGNFAHDLSAHAPRLASDRFAADDLYGQLAGRAALGITTVDSLRPLASKSAAPSRAPLQVHVRGRALRRSDDQRLLDLLTPWSPQRVVFHHALDDTLLAQHALKLKPLLQRLGLTPDTPITHASLSRAIVKAQQP
ncbi:hypothetical protein [Lysobacter fragariae]